MNFAARAPMASFVVNTSNVTLVVVDRVAIVAIVGVDDVLAASVDIDFVPSALQEQISTNEHSDEQVEQT
jgi:hypothetical protein